MLGFVTPACQLRALVAGGPAASPLGAQGDLPAACAPADSPDGPRALERSLGGGRRPAHWKVTKVTKVTVLQVSAPLAGL